MIVGALALVWMNPILAADVSVSLITEDQDICRVEGQFFVAAPLSTVWEVLTDYNRIGEFVPFMKRSNVKETLEKRLLVEQEALARFFFFVRRMYVLLAMQEVPLKRILFRDVSQKDFELYEGSWLIEPSPQGIWVRYKVRAKPNFSVPGFVAREMFRKTARGLLKAVQIEILRRHSVKLRG